MHLIGGDHIVLGLVLLQHEPHGLNVVASVTPVTFRVEITQRDRLLLAEMNLGNAASDLARHEIATTARRLVVEQDAIHGEHIVGLAVVDDDPVGVEFGRAVGRTRVEGRLLCLRYLLDFAVQLRGRCLIKSKRKKKINLI